MIRNLHAGKRHSGGLSLNILTDDELDEIHLATLEILEETDLFIVCRCQILICDLM
jgi:trimethylamine--corrinoid protein Co-methyltransferase